MIRMPNAAARRATSCPIRPRPARPSVLSRIFLPQELLLLPLALFHRRVGCRQVPRHGEHQTDRELRDAHAVRARRVHDDDAPRAGGGNVDVVDPGACTGNDPEARRGGDKRRRDLGGAANDEGVGFGEIAGKLVCCSPCAGIDFPPLRSQQVQRGSRKIVCDDDFQWRVSRSVVVKVRRCGVCATGNPLLGP